MWPSAIELNDGREFGTIPWINISNTLDPIAGHIKFLELPGININIHNLSFNSGFFITQSHTNYFKISNTAEDKLIFQIMKNVIDFGTIDGQSLQSDERGRQKTTIFFQSVIGFLVGFFILPAAVRFLLNFVNFVTSFIRRSYGLDDNLVFDIPTDYGIYSILSFSAATTLVVFIGVLAAGLANIAFIKLRGNGTFSERDKRH
jgi:hypothetical protein